LQITAQIALDRIGYTCLRSILFGRIIYGKLDLNYGAQKGRKIYAESAYVIFLIYEIRKCEKSFNKNKMAFK
jgi:hypothetical protein